jgi:hypothetical protein
MLTHCAYCDTQHPEETMMKMTPIGARKTLYVCSFECRKAVKEEREWRRNVASLKTLILKTK